MNEGNQKMGESDTGGFTVVGAAPEPLHPLTPESARTGYLLFRGDDGFEVAIPDSLVERALAWGRQAAPNEWHGLVYGKLCEHVGARHVVVLGVVPDIEALAKPSYVETTDGSEFRTRLSGRVLFPDGIPLGWIHGHVRHGVRFSSTDLATQRSWTQPHALGIVVDPWNRQRLSVYRGPQSELLTRVHMPSDAVGPASPAPRRREARRPFLARLRELGARRWRVGGIALTLGFLTFLTICVARLSSRVSALEVPPRGAMASPHEISAPTPSLPPSPPAVLEVHSVDADAGPRPTVGDGADVHEGMCR